jgi:cysteine desulfurase
MSDPQLAEETLIYLDHNATTPIDPRVRDAMLPWLGGLHGNPSSAHRPGRAARGAVEAARAQVASLLGSQPEHVMFTSSGTEANNAVLYAVARAHGHRGHLLYSSLEHPSVRRAAEELGAAGMESTELKPGADGRLSVEAVEKALRDDTRMVCLMLANNELGTLQPVAEVASLCRRRGIPVLSDAVQVVGKLPVDVEALGVDYLLLGGHKFHGPPGIAALWTRPGAVPAALLVGAAQERGLRAGTENVPGIVGLGEACALAEAELSEREAHLRTLRDTFEAGLRSIEGAVVHCADSPRLPNTCHVAFLGVSGHQLMLQLDEEGIAVSTGSACHSGKPQPSRVLLDMGVDEAEALASLRVSFGMPNTLEEVAAVLSVLGRVVVELRRGVAVA